jgi:hypothetical protein
MNFPTDINQWDYNTVYRLVTQRDHEPGIYDFKEALSGSGTDEKKENLNDSIRKAVCSMANADGGYLIFGVKDPKHSSNLTEKERIVGIPKSSEYLKEFGDKISGIQRKVHCIYPDKLIALPDNNERGILVIYIPLSPLRPHMFKGTFYTRVSTGSTEQMNWYEVRDQMLYTEGRLQKVRLLRLKIAQFKMLREMQTGIGTVDDRHRELAQHLRYETSEFENLIADICDLIPARTNLLQNLLDLSKTAHILNTAMNPANHFTGNNRSNIQIEESNLLASLCVKCEKLLAELFDPLTKDEI